MQRSTGKAGIFSRRAAPWLGCALAALLGAQAAQAATISAIPQTAVIATGTSVTIDLMLDLAPGEEASSFEGHFDLIGVGSFVENLGPGALTPGGPTWGSASGGIIGTQLVLSLLSANTGGNRLIGRLDVTGLASGVFEIRLASGTFVQRDSAAPPFVEDVPLTTPIGAVLTFVTVTPPQVPALGVLPALALAGSLALSGRRARALRFIRARSARRARS